jgi:hypothetical protein
MFVDPGQHDPLRAVASSGGQLLDSDKLGKVDADVPDENPVADAVYFPLTTNVDKWILAFDIDAKHAA